MDHLESGPGRRHDGWRLRNRSRTIGVACVLALGLGAAPEAWSITTDASELDDVEQVHGGNIQHCDAAVAGGDLLEIVQCGDGLFETVFNAVDGAGANVGDGGRFTRVPRADLDGPGEWAHHVPARATGPNAASCVACHQGAALGGSGDGPGPVAMNAIRDPLGSADPSRFIQRNTPHLFGQGALQRLAEEMTLALRAQFDAGVALACERGTTFDVALTAKGVGFGSIAVGCTGVVDAANVEGVDADLVVRPFQWKGVETTVRSFARGAAHNELGMQAVELTGAGVDGDGDGVADELTIPDMTALAVYLAAQPRPVSELELDRLRLQLAKAGAFDRISQLGLPTLSREDVASISHGEQLFGDIGCADCHRPALAIDDPVFSEPSPVDGYADDPFPAGQPALAHSIRFDLRRDLPDNRIAVGRQVFDLGTFEPTRTGGAIVRLYGDLKRHDMGPRLAENVDETGHGRSVWLTKELWGVGSSAQYLHDGRATTLTEAILEHGGEGEPARAAFGALSGSDAASVVRFLQSLVLFFPEPVDPTASPASHSPSPTRGHDGRRRR